MQRNISRSLFLSSCLEHKLPNRADVILVSSQHPLYVIDIIVSCRVRQSIPARYCLTTIQLSFQLNFPHIGQFPFFFICLEDSDPTPSLLVLNIFVEICLKTKLAVVRGLYAQNWVEFVANRRYCLNWIYVSLRAVSQRNGLIFELV